MGKLTHRTAPGCTYFVTTKIWGGRSLFQVKETADIMLEVLFRHRAAGAYYFHEFVLMPNHLHLLLTPAQTVTLEKVMQLIKGGSSYAIHKRRSPRIEVWQPGFYESTIRDARDYGIKMTYIRMNPVTAKLVDKPEDWPYSSVGRAFDLDEWPTMFSSAAKAATRRSELPELKLRPPKERFVGGSKGDPGRTR